MKTKTTTLGEDNRIKGYTLWLSASDTWAWAHKPGSVWPCSTLEGNRACVVVDSNGLCNLTINGREAGDIDGTELDACVLDHLPAKYRHLWPVWKTT